MSPVADNSVATNGKSSTINKSARNAAVGTPPSPPKFASKEKEREYLKFRLAQAFRIFGQLDSMAHLKSSPASSTAGKLGYDEGVAGHITVRVSNNICALPSSPGINVAAGCCPRRSARPLIVTLDRTLSAPTAFGSTLSYVHHVYNLTILCRLRTRILAGKALLLDSAR